MPETTTTYGTGRGTWTVTVKRLGVTETIKEGLLNHQHAVNLCAELEAQGPCIADIEWVPAHRLIPGIVPTTVQCACGWYPTYNKTAHAQQAEWEDHQAGRL